MRRDSVVGMFHAAARMGAVAGAYGGATIAAATTNDLTLDWARVKSGFLFGALLGALITAGPMAMGVWNPFVLTAVMSTGLPLAGMIFYPPIKRSRLSAKYRQYEQHLIKP